MDKYESLKNVTNWIENSSSEEFMSTFNSLNNNYSNNSITLGDFIDHYIDNNDKFKEFV